jgi:hypothetical protein
VALCARLGAQRTVACWPINTIGLFPMSVFSGLYTFKVSFTCYLLRLASSPAYASIRLLPV